MTAPEAEVIERAIAYCKGQAMYDPQTADDHAYDRGVAACVRILEDMLPIDSSHVQGDADGKA